MLFYAFIRMMDCLLCRLMSAGRDGGERGVKVPVFTGF